MRAFLEEARSLRGPAEDPDHRQRPLAERAPDLASQLCGQAVARNGPEQSPQPAPGDPVVDQAAAHVDHIGEPQRLHLGAERQLAA